MNKDIEEQTDALRMQLSVRLPRSMNWYTQDGQLSHSVEV